MKDKSSHLHVLELKKNLTVRGTRFQDKYFRCIDPDCFFTMKASDLIGKRAKCPQCLKDYIVKREQLSSLKSLHCEECTKGAKAKARTAEAKAQEERVENFLEKMGIKLT